MCARYKFLGIQLSGGGGVWKLTKNGAGLTSTAISCSIKSTDGSYVTKTLGTDANNNKSSANSWAGGKEAFAYINFDTLPGVSDSSEIRLFTSSAISSGISWISAIY